MPVVGLSSCYSLSILDFEIILNTKDVEMTSTWRRLFALLAVFGLLAAACGSDDSDSASEAVAEAEAETVDFKIGLVTDTGKVDDKSFNQSAWEGAQEAAASIGAEVDYIETEASKDYEANIQLFLDDGANVIVTVGFGMGEATIAAANANPEVMFIGVYQGQWGCVIPNLAGLIFPEDKSGFLA